MHQRDQRNAERVGNVPPAAHKARYLVGLRPDAGERSPTDIRSGRSLGADLGYLFAAPDIDRLAKRSTPIGKAVISAIHCLGDGANVVLVGVPVAAGLIPLPR